MSLSHWSYEGVAPSVTFGSVGSGLEMNLAYANSWLFPAIFTAWLSPIWINIPYFVFFGVRPTRPPPSKTLASQLAYKQWSRNQRGLFVMMHCESLNQKNGICGQGRHYESVCPVP
jgi:hypothetical protein